MSFLDTALSEEDTSPVRILEPGEIDPRFLRMSYSSELGLHECPRRFQLGKLQADSIHDYNTEITFSYGHVIGEGIQQYLITRDWNKTVWAMFTTWHTETWAENEKQKKSLLSAIGCLMQFVDLVDAGMFDDYEVAYINGKPAAELSFCIQFPRVQYRGYVDLVLRHIITGELLVLELKTSSANYVNHYNYKNSAQAIGYSVILDKIEPGCTSYNVQYLVWMTKLNRFEPFDFPKSMTQRALWLQDRLWDEETLERMLERFGNYGNWPTHGESCTNFGRVCPYMDFCHQPTESLMSLLREKHYKDLRKNLAGEWEEAKYDFYIDFEELLA
tara:strand:- start:30847 stop:31836 length:990 start_codon:yes stop_codon:yes gene_type:complete